MLCHNIGSRHHGIALRHAKRYCDHILRQMLAPADAGVEACLDDIDERRLRDDL
jgi:hypothetical protein